MTRTCDCPHPYPVCTCSEGHRGAELLRRSKFASSLAGWPGRARPTPPAPDPAKLRVGIITPAALTGGAEIWVLNLLDYCDRTRIDWQGVCVLYPYHVDPWMSGELARRGRVGRGHEFAAELYAQCDVVIAWGVPPAELKLPPRPRHCRVILVSHGVGPWTRRIFADTSEVDELAAVSSAALRPIPHDRRPFAHAIGNCYDPVRIKPTRTRDEIRAAWGVSPAERVLGYLGRLSPEKNPGAMLRFCAGNGSRVVFAGAGPEEPSLRERAHPSVVFAGTMHPGDALAGFDRLVMPSHEEGCSLALLEAWAAGVPVVSTPTGIVPQYPGLVRQVPLDPDASELALALDLEYHIDQASVPARVERAKATALAYFGPEQFGQKWTTVLHLIAPEEAQARVTRARKPRVPLGRKHCATCP